MQESKLQSAMGARQCLLLCYPVIQSKFLLGDSVPVPDDLVEDWHGLHGISRSKRRNFEGGVASEEAGV